MIDLDIVACKQSTMNFNKKTQNRISRVSSLTGILVHAISTTIKNRDLSNYYYLCRIPRKIINYIQWTTSGGSNKMIDPDIPFKTLPLILNAAANLQHPFLNHTPEENSHECPGHLHSNLEHFPPRMSMSWIVAGTQNLIENSGRTESMIKASLGF